jgi:hypothetical protein
VLRVFLSLAFAAHATAASFDHSAWDRVLKAGVNLIGEVDYAALKGNRDLTAYVEALRASSPDNRKDLFPSRGDELAYWINAYNALTTWGVVKAYPTKGVRDLGLLFGFFRRKEYVLGGRVVSLMELENEIIRARYKEPRIHFAIVCASLSCPKLSSEAYTAANLERQLAFQTEQFFAETRNLAVSGDRVFLAKILDWYAADFGGTKASALEFALKHAPEPKRAAVRALKHPRIVFRDYDWSINDPGSRARAKWPEERELAKP